MFFMFLICYTCSSYVLRVSHLFCVFLICSACSSYVLHVPHGFCLVVVCSTCFANSLHVLNEFSRAVEWFWGRGHQAVEAKEGVEIGPQLQPSGSITYQTFFRFYKKLAGMTVRESIALPAPPSFTK